MLKLQVFLYANILYCDETDFRYIQQQKNLNAIYVKECKVKLFITLNWTMQHGPEFQICLQWMQNMLSRMNRHLCWYGSIPIQLKILFLYYFFLRYMLKHGATYVFLWNIGGHIHQWHLHIWISFRLDKISILKHDRIKGINLIFDTTTFVWYYDHYYYLHFVRQCRMQTIRPHPS